MNPANAGPPGDRVEIEEVDEWEARFDAAEENSNRVKERLFREHVRLAGMAGARRFRRLYGRRPKKRARERRYLVIVEEMEGGFVAYAPDLPGCKAVGATWEEVRKTINRVVRSHIRTLQGRGMPLPESRTALAYVDVLA